MAFTLPIGAEAPGFSLPGADGRNYSLADFAKAKVLVVFFTCNHCPYVTGSEKRISALHDEFHPRGVDWVGINANETDGHPTDSLEHMKKRVAESNIRYPYLRDDAQDVARAYGALRTPHFYVFDRQRRLRYTGRMDDNPYDATKAKQHDLRNALDALLAGRGPAVDLTNPIGCNVKWKNQDAHWMPPEACDLVPRE